MGQENTRVAAAYAAYGHLVRLRCVRILRDESAAEDAFQEAFVRVLLYGDSYERAESKIAWLYRVAERCCFDRLRRHKTRRESPLADLDPVWNGNVSAGEDRQIILRFLDQFDDRMKQIAILHFIDELTQEEIAGVVGCTRQTVAKKIERLQSAAQRMRKGLEK